MNEGSLTITFTVDRTPEEAFDAITNVRGWWLHRQQLAQPDHQREGQPNPTEGDAA
jgi:hypothetical protein